ncbi:bifunctional Histone-lysine N-methyltransferase DOT1 domain/S-adenosyl-L-methionine-dependent methyltransferase superfamily [Babesia duncani]|uniref:Bifunctional Histone-lysine N-methyltransferase DOT1 domain/S-adenosyl-L-methionine-dependent methyltransferase superfamily n=1 Tax=Babesia duncani TaxID=323732 RepID=A0AAD9UMG0_9APIC|nr:bifunctional Histone-lysine N-methyltransferase DOT1 domain/S-adenosyl-L-methionine-dependent methyltransferase superfamily [Babesia duncani]KAK2195995.1 bifunctional Histone-lysine N-methyltransferase DOT1 domain/S-adenosyl-L-methionine-dependent methyltransferase superfamily [Babesia duncani]
MVAIELNTNPLSNPMLLSIMENESTPKVALSNHFKRQRNAFDNSESSRSTSFDENESFENTPKRKTRGKRIPYSDTDAEISNSLALDEFFRIYFGNHNTNDKLEFLFRGATSKISTSTAGMYGEIRPGSLRNVCRELEKYGLDKNSIILDLGSGRGVPNCIFAHSVPIYASIGVELCPLAYSSAVHILLTILGRDVAMLKHESQAKIESFECNNNTEFDAETITPTRVASSVKNECNLDTCLVDYGLFGENDETPKPRMESHESSIHSDAILMETLSKFETTASKMGLAFVNEDLTAFSNFDGVTHFYSFDTAMEKPLINNMVHQFQKTKTAWLFASFQNNLIKRFGLKDAFLASKVPCQMYGSGESHICFIYVKNDWEKIKQMSDARLPRNVGSIKINKWFEPSDATEIIKLAKMPLKTQFEWYLRKMNKINKSCVTRSKKDSVGYSKDERDKLFKQREELVEKIAMFESPQYHKRLREHIQHHYKSVGTFP